MAYLTDKQMEIQALRARPVLVVANRADWLHGDLVTNRAERRRAEAIARKYGCDPGGTEHGKGCPKYKPAPRERVQPKSAQVGQ